MDLYYEVSGEGRPVILLHSGGADLRDWTFVAPILAKHYQVITFDGRGCGKSPSPTETANYVEDLLSVMDHFQLDEATLVGHSIGGRIATDFALTYPQRVSKLVLIAPSLTGYTPSQPFTEWMQKIQEAPDVDRMVELSLSACPYRVVMASPQKDFMVEMAKHNLAKMLKWATWESVWPQPPAIERLKELANQTCLIIGMEDALDAKRMAEYFKEVLPERRFIEIAGADHKPTLTHPEEIARAITEFLED
ncbi:alpha/beta hydrolase [Brevibacillus sp. HB1.3]|uniref:alpha/beta fold hydrolase n=1 Tax=Brevibacillus sp. HB1.3 TaxID=2738842 RepID=UPI001556A2F4|nr:alpha/beta hydrolase [Brevibacillus sp. HB1.3]NQF12950.1 alpha/beta hydrolase [Brevibacillus sp. HB1.3]